jgi:hypothetical protein
MMDGDDDQGFVTQWQKIPIPKNPQRARKRLKASQTLQSRRERFTKHIEEQVPESHAYLHELRNRFPPNRDRSASLSQSPRIFISEQDAFDMLCAECLRTEKFPQDILNKGKATGWFERMRMLGEKYNWDVKISVRDKGQ